MKENAPNETEINEEPVIRISTAGLPSWLPIPFFSFEVLRRYGDFSDFTFFTFQISPTRGSIDEGAELEVMVSSEFNSLTSYAISGRKNPGDLTSSSCFCDP